MSLIVQTVDWIGRPSSGVENLTVHWYMH